MNIETINRDLDALKCSTPYGINGLDTLSFSGSTPTQPPCSTPYGINGLDTGHNSVAIYLSIVVLNALRHQWFGHLKNLYC